jgi:hypothetical protein
VTGPGATLAQATRQALLDGQAKGVVLVGGYDVVPSQRVDVLDAELRGRMPADLIARDRDGFVVWSDDVYGDREPDGVPELPVPAGQSRNPASSRYATASARSPTRSTRLYRGPA